MDKLSHSRNLDKLIDMVYCGMGKGLIRLPHKEKIVGSRPTTATNI